jgi:hypothetical protein
VMAFKQCTIGGIMYGYETSISVVWIFYKILLFYRSGNISEFNSYELLKNLEQHVSERWMRKMCIDTLFF